MSRHALVVNEEVVSFVDCVVTGATPAADHTVALRLAVTFGPLPEGWEYAVAFVRGRLTPATTVLDLGGPQEVTTSVSGLGESAFSWYLGDFEHGRLPDEPLVVHAVVPAERHEREVELTVRVDGSFRRPRFPVRRHLDHARAAEPWTFRLTLPADHAAAEPKPAAAVPVNGAIRLCVAADIEKYSRFHNLEAMRAQERFVELMRRARAHAGIDEAEVDRESAGDSEYAILPAGLDETVVVPRLLAGFDRAARAVNNDLNDHARLRVRVALDRGLVTPSVNGWVGRSTIAVHRLLDSEPVRAALADHPDRDCAIIVSDTIYQDVARHGYEGMSPGEFSEALVNLPNKNFTERAWLHIPGN
ncbi:hypothetical protein ABZ345_08375 [Lentzea sp. NPDC005914]|uniref:hypothetical protein n=1 Tax=Lentzea sp. NPDC005914 TaxID=3154572 RepID=UPI0033CD37A8